MAVRLLFWYIAHKTVMSIKFTILGLLHYRDLHGYRIKEVIEKNFGYMWTINFGQIYHNLKKLLEEELISVEAENRIGEKGPPRKRYSITNKGKEAFSDWLSVSPGVNMLLRDPFLMRFVFFGFGDPERSVEIIDDQIQEYREQLVQRETNMETWQRNDIYVTQMADLGIRMNRLLLEWMEESKQKILDASMTGESV